MSFLPGFDKLENERQPFAAELGGRLKPLAERGVYFGTSSWKYEGWIGSIYSAERYQGRNGVSQSKFEANCLAEYAETFPIVCGDFSFYQFPSASYWARLFEATPQAFLFGLKVPEELTVTIWPKHARYGKRAGQRNENFLNPELCETALLELLRPYQNRVATLIFEFGTIPKKEIDSREEFQARLDEFLAALPPGFRYAVEIRNPEYFTPDYCRMLGQHNAAHVFNAWTRMPNLTAQTELDEAFSADFVVARALLARGRMYEDAVKLFSPYERIQQRDEPTRQGLRRILDRVKKTGGPAFLFVNNRLEGFAPGTIFEVVSGDTR